MTRDAITAAVLAIFLLACWVADSRRAQRRFEARTEQVYRETAQAVVEAIKVAAAEELSRTAQLVQQHEDRIERIHQVCAADARMQEEKLADALRQVTRAAIALSELSDSLERIYGEDRS